MMPLILLECFLVRPRFTVVADASGGVSLASGGIGNPLSFLLAQQILPSLSLPFSYGLMFSYKLYSRALISVTKVKLKFYKNWRI